MPEDNVDILMATYNGECFVREQIESIQKQTYTNWHLIISDDLSSDETPAVLDELAGKDSRIVVLPNKERWGSAKANFGHLIRSSEASYMMLCDQDDCWLPSKIEESLSAIKLLEDEHGSHVPLLVFCDMKVVDGNLSILHESFEASSNFDPTRLSLRHLIAQNVAAGCCMLFNRATAELFLEAEDSEPMDMHDWWLMLVASAFGHIGYINEPLSLYRQHGSNEVGANDYSPSSRMKNQDFMLMEFLKTTKQADAFTETYAGRLSGRDLEALRCYSSIGRDKSFGAALLHLAKSGCWKKGARKLGQLAMLAKVIKVKQEE